MSKQKIYVIKKGKKTGIFNDWEECKELVNGYPNAEYKSFTNLEEAVNYLNNQENVLSNRKETNDLLISQIKYEIQSGITVAFVDGSYEHAIKKFSYGSYIQTLKENKIIEIKFCEAYNDEKLLQFRNVSGEIFGVLKTLEWCINNNIKKIKIYYDYIGIEKWINNSWKANTDISILYKDKFNELKDKFDIILFQKVEAHNGIQYNEIADQLAKEALENK